MVPITRQDLQSVIDNARSRLQERMVTQQDLRVLQDAVRVLTSNLQQSQQLLRQDEYQRVQLVRKTVAVETRMGQLEHELQNMRRAIMQLAQNQPAERVTERVIMTQAEAPQAQPQPGANYSYNPT